MSIKRSIFYTSFVQLPSVIMGFATGIIITRLLQEVGRGYYTLLQTDIALLVLLLSLNLGSGLIYFLAKGNGDKKHIIGIAVSGLLIIAGVLGIVLALAWYHGVPANPILPAGVNSFFFVAFLLGALFLGITNSFFVGIFLGLRQYRVVNQMTLASAVLLLLAYGLLYWRVESLTVVGKLRWVLGVGLGAQAGIALMWLAQYVWHIRVWPVLFRAGNIFIPLLSFATIGYLANLLNQLNYRLDIWFLQEMRGAGELGLYAVAVGIGQFFFQIPEPLSRVLQPFLIGEDREAGLKQFTLYARLSFTLVFVGGAILMLLSSWLFPFVYGEAFDRSALAFQLLMPGILFACGAKMMVLLVIRTGKVYYNVLASAVGLVFTIALNILLVPRFGLAGASIASTVSYGAVFFVVLWVVFRRLGVPWGNYFLLLPEDVRSLTQTPSRPTGNMSHDYSSSDKSGV